MESYNKEYIQENPILMEVDDDGTLEEWDGNDIEKIYCECIECGKKEDLDIYEGNAWRKIETGLYFCDDCIKKLNEMRYFYQLELKGILQENIPRITKIYPKYKTYNLQNIKYQKSIIENFQTFLEGEAA